MVSAFLRPFTLTLGTGAGGRVGPREMAASKSSTQARRRHKFKTGASEGAAALFLQSAGGPPSLLVHWPSTLTSGSTFMCCKALRDSIVKEILGGSPYADYEATLCLHVPWSRSASVHCRRRRSRRFREVPSLGEGAPEHPRALHLWRMRLRHGDGTFTCKACAQCP